ncbi:MAG: hypothetical protein ACFFB2_20970 [Promethearchaeota archaeon]
MGKLNEYKSRFGWDPAQITYLTGFLIFQGIINIPLYFFFFIPNFSHFTNEWEIYHEILLGNQPIFLTLLFFCSIILFIQILGSIIFVQKCKAFKETDPHKVQWVWSHLIYFGITLSLMCLLDFIIPESRQWFLWRWSWFVLAGLAFSGFLASVSFIGLLFFSLFVFLRDYSVMLMSSIKIIEDYSFNYTILGMETILVGDYIPVGGIKIMLTILRLFSPMLLFFPIILFKIGLTQLKKPVSSTEIDQKTLGDRVKRHFGIYCYFQLTVAYWVVFPIYLMILYVQEYSMNNETAITVGYLFFLIITVLCIILPIFLIVKDQKMPIQV